MKASIPCLCAALLAGGVLGGEPKVAVPADPAMPQKSFDPYTPEEYVRDDETFKFKWYRFSKRQLEFMESTEFDGVRFAKYLRTKWPMDKLTNYTRETAQARLPNQVGYKAARFFTVDVYGGMKHRFDVLEVTVFDQYGNGGGSIWTNQLHHSNMDGTRDAIKRWAWLITIKKGRKSWSIQEELPNIQFEKTKPNKTSLLTPDPPPVQPP